MILNNLVLNWKREFRRSVTERDWLILSKVRGG